MLIWKEIAQAGFIGVAVSFVSGRQERDTVRDNFLVPIGLFLCLATPFIPSFGTTIMSG